MLEDIKSKIEAVIESVDEPEHTGEYVHAANKLSDISNELVKLRKSTVEYIKGIDTEFIQALDIEFQNIIFEIGELANLCDDKEDYFIACSKEAL